MKYVLFLTVLIFGCSYLVGQENCAQEIHARFDIGSGTTKMLVAQTSTCAPGVQAVLLESSRSVGYARDLEQSQKGFFSEDIQGEGTRAIQELINEAKRLGPKSIRGVATQAFRKASNGGALLERWNQRFGTSFVIISQEQEGELAYRLVQWKMQNKKKEERPLVVWDIGGGSQQFIREVKKGKLDVLKTDLASVTYRESLVHLLPDRHTDEPITPVSYDEIQAILNYAKELAHKKLPNLKEWFPANARLVGLGGVHGASIVKQVEPEPGYPIQTALIRGVISRDHLKMATGRYRATEFSNLILVLAFLEILDVEEYEVISSNLTEAQFIDLHL